MCGEAPAWKTDGIAARIFNLPVSAKIVAACADFRKRKGAAETGRTQRFVERSPSLCSSRLSGVSGLRLDRAVQDKAAAFWSALAGRRSFQSDLESAADQSGVKPPQSKERGGGWASHCRMRFLRASVVGILFACLSLWEGDAADLESAPSKPPSILLSQRLLGSNKVELPNVVGASR